MREKYKLRFYVLLLILLESGNKVFMMMPPLLQYFWFQSIYSLAARSLLSRVCSLQMSYTEPLASLVQICHFLCNMCFCTSPSPQTLTIGLVASASRLPDCRHFWRWWNHSLCSMEENHNWCLFLHMGEVELLM